MTPPEARRHTTERNEMREIKTEKKKTKKKHIFAVLDDCRQSGVYVTWLVTHPPFSRHVFFFSKNTECLLFTSIRSDLSDGAADGVRDPSQRALRIVCLCCFVAQKSDNFSHVD